MLAEVNAVAAVAQHSRVRAVQDVGPAGCAILVLRESPFGGQPLGSILAGVYRPSGASAKDGIPRRAHR